MVAKVADASGEAMLSFFNDQAETVVGCSAEELDSLKSQVTHAIFSLIIFKFAWYFQ